MRFDHDIFVEDEVDEAVMEKLIELRKTAKQSDMDDLTYSRMLTTAAQIALLDYESGESDEQSGGGPVCPVCDERVRHVESLGIGDDPVLRPCGHEVKIDEASDELRQLIFD